MSNNQTINKNNKLSNTINEKIQHRAVKNLKTTKSGGKRFWEESADFSRNFNPGDTVNYFYDMEKKVFIIEKTEVLGTHTVSSRANGKPIIDIKNKRLTELFENVEKVEILYYPNKLIVKVANAETRKNQRSAKTSFKTYELFCGGGTLTDMFKQAGFEPIGGLEIEDKYLYSFEQNHRTKDTYTISASIEDILPEVYPKDIDVALVGIPCTNYSKANKQLQEALNRKRKGIATIEDEQELEKVYTSEALTYYVLEAIRAMNVRTVVVEEVVEYSTSPASFMLRTVLKQMGYQLSETISTGTQSKRKRWCLIANMNSKIDLSNVLPSNKRTVESILEIPINKRDWKPASEHPRIKRASEKDSIGIRSVLPSDTMINTFTTHWTRSTEPILKHPTQELYSEFTNNEIKRNHAVSDNYILPEKKTIARQVLGQGVTDMFYYIAKRIKEENIA